MCVISFLLSALLMYIHKSEALHWHWRWGGAESRGNSGGGGPFSQFNSNVFKMSSNFTCLIYMVSCFCVTAIDAKLFRIHTRDKEDAIVQLIFQENDERAATTTYCMYC